MTPDQIAAIRKHLKGMWLYGLDADVDAVFDFLSAEHEELLHLRAEHERLREAIKAVNRYHWNEASEPCQNANCTKSHWLDGHSVDAAAALDRTQPIDAPRSDRAEPIDAALSTGARQEQP